MYNKARFLLAPLGLGLLLSVPFAGCGSNDGTGSGAGGTGGKVGNTGGSNTGGGPSGGAGATSTGGSDASGGQTGNGTGGSGTGGARTGGSGGTSSSGSNTGGTQSGGAGGVGTGGATSGSGTGTGGTTGASTGGTTGSGTGGNATGGSSGYTAVPTCPSLYDANSAGPPALQPHASQAQSAYQHAELTSFIHLGMATFDNTEQGDMSKDVPTLFNPTNLTQDTVNAWVKSLKDAGFKQAMLTAKHSTGFCLWPSAYTDYSVKSSSWMSGKGDVVKMFTDAMHAAGMRVGLYLAPWDQKYPSSSANYETYYKNQLTELLSNYGPVYEIWADGANAPTSNVNWKSVFALAKQLQPAIVAWAGPEVANVAGSADAQWIGNEQGLASRTTSSLDTSNCGKQANSWCAWEVDVSSRPGWFWHQSESPKSVSQVESIFFTSVGMNSNLIFNVPPSTTGEFDPKDVALLKQFGDWYSSTFKTNLLKEQPATADSTWATAGFDAAKALDDDICTYWAAASGKTSGRLEVTPASAMTIKAISVREPIELGERVTKYHVELKQNGTWNTAPTDASGAKIQGTIVGQRQLWNLNSTSAQAIALVIESARGVPAISEFSAY